MLSGPSETEAVGTQEKHPSTLAMSPDSDTLKDVDLIWGETEDGPNREWSKMDEEFTNAGYREGITAGKESALQEGFDESFAQVGAPLGREIGLLRGVAGATFGLLSSQISYANSDILERHRNEIRSIIGSLGSIHLEDLAPRDLQAEEHTRKHLDSGTSSDALVSYGVDSHNVAATKSDNDQIKPAVEELGRLRSRLSHLLQEIGLKIPLV